MIHRFFVARDDGAPLTESGTSWGRRLDLVATVQIRAMVRGTVGSRMFRPHQRAKKANQPVPHCRLLIATPWPETYHKSVAKSSVPSIGQFLQSLAVFLGLLSVEPSDVQTRRPPPIPRH